MVFDGRYIWEEAAASYVLYTPPPQLLGGPAAKSLESETCNSVRYDVN